jgi:hypothetical protein
MTWRLPSLMLLDNSRAYQQYGLSIPVTRENSCTKEYFPPHPLQKSGNGIKELIVVKGEGKKEPSLPSMLEMYCL